jgi:hypothetical protein
MNTIHFIINLNPKRDDQIRRLEITSDPTSITNSKKIGYPKNQKPQKKMRTNAQKNDRYKCSVPFNRNM